ncbi:hypothetical protein ACHQM5_000483 [Ranunculus cassubicifolius]
MKNLHFLFLPFLFIIDFSSSAFTPQDSYTINCGGPNLDNLRDDTRSFNGDLTQVVGFTLSNTGTDILSDSSQTQSSSALYQTARVFTKELKYQFEVKRKGLHMVRLHFFPFTAKNYDLNSAKFHVSVDEVEILRDFSPVRNTSISASTGDSVVLKEYIVRANGEEFVVKFTPVSSSGFGFVNAIEFFSVPDDFFVLERVTSIGSDGVDQYKGTSFPVLETLHRINAGGRKITPLNDTLWRTWIPDENFLVLPNAARAVSRTDRLNYKDGGASREDAPDQVYMTAQEMNKNSLSIANNFNVTWKFPLSSNAGKIKYLVRMHFCDIVSAGLNQLYFDVYINNHSAFEDVDLSKITLQTMASPRYMDIIVSSENSDHMFVQVGPSTKSSLEHVNAILNGLEILRMVNVHGSSSERGPKKGSIGLIVGAVVGGVLVLILCVAGFLMLKCRRKKRKRNSAENASWIVMPGQGGSSDSKVSQGTFVGSSPGSNLPHLGLKISFADVQYATNDFDESHVIGSGGFGKVYKGVLRDNTNVAVKRSHPGSGQGLSEFTSEITVLSRIRHRHLVSLVGYCEENGEMILVYELMEKGALRDHLYGSTLPHLSWTQRLEILIGAAKGLHYLHTGSAQGIIHRDVKSTNILLDKNNVAKVADFGLSRSGPGHNETHVSTVVKGSFGYLDPEYFKRLQLTDKSDVYSFGVVLLEVICARPAIDSSLTRDEVNLAEWALQWQKKGLLEQVIDPLLSGDIKPNSLRKFGDTAEKCLAVYGADRPTMGDVLWSLEYALQLQQTGHPREPHEDSAIAPELPVPRVMLRAPSTNVSIEGEDSSDLSSSTVNAFSQLITNEGR